ncbi:PAS domain-containing protein [Enterobacteriaceae bacterium 89]|nr:PAS domain-containing protein [Enterobacteriaceae bacterium 89]
MPYECDVGEVERLKKENLKLKNENKLFRIILDHVSEGIQVSSAEESMLYYNSACEKIEGISREECLGKSLKEVYSKTSYTKDNTLHRVVWRTGVPAINVYNRYNTNKKLTEVFSSTWSFEISNELKGVFSILREAAPTKNYLEDINLLKQKGQHNLPVNDDKSERYYIFEDIVHSSKTMANCIEYARKVAHTSANIMLYGETGVGKELFAQSIHNASPHAQGPFVAINCAAIPDTLLESLLFGTEKGSFSGAVLQKGLLEQAENGTFFLDELNSMPLSLQAKILRAIEMRTCRRLGGSQDIRINCRFICSTNIDPQELLSSKTVRSDLYYRLSTVIIHIPPLRNRIDDLESLIQMFIQDANKHYHTNVADIEPELLDIYHKYNWPGNVRELKHDIDSCILLSNSVFLSKKSIPAYLYKKYTANSSSSTPVEQPDFRKSIGPCTTSLRAMLDNIESEIIENTLNKCNGNISMAAKYLGLHRQALQYRLKKFSSEE